MGQGTCHLVLSGEKMLKKRNQIIVVGIILFMVAVFVFLRFGGVWLVEEDEIEDLDDAVVVLLMGSVGDRALGAVSTFINRGSGRAYSYGIILLLGI